MMRDLACPRRPRSMKLCLARTALTICGTTDSSYPRIPGNKRSPDRSFVIRFDRISSFTGRDVYPLALNSPSVRIADMGLFYSHESRKLALESPLHARVSTACVSGWCGAAQTSVLINLKSRPTADAGGTDLFDNLSLHSPNPKSKTSKINRRTYSPRSTPPQFFAVRRSC